MTFKTQDQFVEYGVQIREDMVPRGSWTTDHSEAVRTMSGYMRVFEKEPEKLKNLKIVERAVIIKATDWYPASEPFLTADEQYENSRSGKFG